MTIRDVSEEVGALALQGPTSADVLRQVADVDIDALKYFRVTSGAIRNVSVDVSRTGYTGDLGYEIWMPWEDAGRVWDASNGKDKPGKYELQYFRLQTTSTCIKDGQHL